jgi:hypothetical protein
MAPKHHARPAATRGPSSARLWQDLRQCARLARSEGVSVERRPGGGILITPLPLNDSTNAAGNPQHAHEKKKKSTPDAGAEPMDTRGPAPQPSKKQQRDERRAKDDQALRASPFIARWTLLTQRLVRDARRTILDSTHSAWKRSRTPEAQLETRRKWRALLWGEWTRARFAPPPMPALPAGCVSHRECRCSGRARSATSTFSRVLELSAVPQVSRSRTTSQGGYANRGYGRHPPTALRVQRRVRRRPGFQPPSLRATARRSHAAALEGRRRNVAIIFDPAHEEALCVCACVWPRRDPDRCLRATECGSRVTHIFAL